MPFPCSVKETPACPTADISLTLSSARDVRGIFLKEQWDIPLLWLLKWPWKAIDNSCAGGSVLWQYNVVTFSSLSLVLVLSLAHAFKPEWECYCNKLTLPSYKSPLRLPKTTKLYLKLSHYGRVIYLPWHAIKWLVAVLGKDAIKSADEW